MAGIFGYNARGFSFEVQNVCSRMHQPLDCSVLFADDSNIALKFSGNSKIKTDADIAGLGICIALFTQVFGIFLMALFFILYDINGRNRPSYYRMLFTFSDVLTVQAVVYVVNFILTAKCNFTTYHYFVALDSLLLFGSTMVCVFVTSRYHYWETFAGVLRFSATLVIFAMLCVFLGYQTKHGTNVFPDWKIPAHNDSTLLLPVACFIDPDLIEFKEFGNPYAPKQTTTGPQLDRIGQSSNVFSLPELWLFWIIVLLLVLGTFCSCCLAARPRNNLHARMTKMSKFFIGFTFVACLGTDLFCVIHISMLRKWAGSSGWLENGSEGEMSPFSQLMAVASLVVVAFAIFDHVPFRAVDRYTDKPHGYTTV